MNPGTSRVHVFLLYVRGLTLRLPARATGVVPQSRVDLLVVRASTDSGRHFCIEPAETWRQIINGTGWGDGPHPYKLARRCEDTIATVQVVQSAAWLADETRRERCFASNSTNKSDPTNPISPPAQQVTDSYNCHIAVTSQLPTGAQPRYTQ